MLQKLKGLVSPAFLIGGGILAVLLVPVILWQVLRKKNYE